MASRSPAGLPSAQGRPESHDQEQGVVNARARANIRAKLRAQMDPGELGGDHQCTGGDQQSRHRQEEGQAGGDQTPERDDQDQDLTGRTATPT